MMLNLNNNIFIIAIYDYVRVIYALRKWPHALSSEVIVYTVREFVKPWRSVIIDDKLLHINI